MDNQKTIYDSATYRKLCEDEAPKYVEQKFCGPTWAKNIRSEYADLIYNTCMKNLNEDSGVFSLDGVDMDLAGSVGKFFQKHPHIEYVCPIPWRNRILTVIKTNFSEACDVIRKQRTVLGEEDDELLPQDSSLNPNQPISQAMHDVSNRVWAAWRVMTDMVSGQLVARFNAGEVEDRDFQNAVKVRDSLKKIAADIDDLSLSFQIVRKKDEEKDDED